MTLMRRVAPLLRAGLVVLFGLLLVLQTLSFPGQFAHLAAEHPEQAWLRWPLTVFVAVEILCAQVIVVCTWRLLTLVTRDSIFTEPALRWVDVIVGAVGTAWVLAAGGALWAVWGADDPGGPLLMLVALLFGAVAGLVVLVLRELLRRATGMRSELAAVI